MHSLCSYHGKLKPSLAHHLIDIFSSPGDLVVDPFSGAGTVPYEACRSGRIGYGIDISALGYVLTRAKISRLDQTAIKALVEDLQESITSGTVSTSEQDSAAAVAFNSSIPEYFHPHTLREILIARRFFRNRWGESDEWAFVFACCLHILHGNRPYALSRCSHPITPFAPTGRTDYRALIPRLSDKINRALEIEGQLFVAGAAKMLDCARSWELPRAASAVITSPPFLDSTKFYMTNWLRFWFAGWERKDFDVGIDDFFETRQRKTLDAYVPFFNQAAESLKHGGFLVMHLGFSRKRDMAAELAKIVPREFEPFDTFYEGVEHCESHGIRDKGAVTRHSYLVLHRK